MRILHFYPNYRLFTHGGGVERYIHHLSRFFQQQGHHVTIAARQADEENETPYRIVTGHYRTMLQEISQADIVHIHGPRMFSSAIVGMLAYLCRVPLFYTVHCFYHGKTRRQRMFKYLWDHGVERLLLLMADRTITLSDYWQRYIARRWLPIRRLIVLPNGIDSAQLSQPSVTTSSLQGAPALLSVSRLDPVKSIEDIVIALNEPGMQTAHLHIVGKGNDEARLRAMVAAQSLTARVTFHGFKTDAEVDAMVRAADVFVLASAEEGMPTTILEMLARGLPVVASAIPGNLALTEALGWHYTYPLHDCAALAARIQAVYKTSVPDSVKTRLVQQFDWSSIANTLLTYYHAAR